MRNAVIASIGFFSIGLIACSTALEAPPLDVAYRDSLVGIGKIVRITNTSSEVLTELEVRIENPNGDVKNHTLPSLAGGETVELGWKKLDGFEVRMGARVNVEAAGFVLPYRAELAEEAESAER